MTESQRFLDWLEQGLAAYYAGDQRKAGLSAEAIKQIRSGLDLLLSIGHDLEFRDTTIPVLSFPQTLWFGQDQLVVENLEELNSAVAAGWRGIPGHEQPRAGIGLGLGTVKAGQSTSIDQASESELTVAQDMPPATTDADAINTSQGISSDARKRKPVDTKDHQ